MVSPILFILYLQFLGVTIAASCLVVSVSGFRDISPDCAGMGLQRDLLLVPLGSALHDHLLGAPRLDSSQSQRRRARRYRGQNNWLEAGLRSLNELAGFPAGSSST